jgi:hypothetical protein
VDIPTIIVLPNGKQLIKYKLGDVPTKIYNNLHGKNEVCMESCNM